MGPSHLRLEFVLIRDSFNARLAHKCMQNPSSWQVLGEHFHEKIAGHDDASRTWPLDSFTLWLEELKMVTRCYDCQPASDDVWLYQVDSQCRGETLEDIIEEYREQSEWEDDEEMRGAATTRDDDQRARKLAVLFGQVVVRKVPCALVFHCHLSILEPRRFHAIFTTLAGNQVLDLQEELEDVLTAAYLIQRVKRMAELNGQLRSQNQEIHVVLNGAAEALDKDAVLWTTSPRPVGPPSRLLSATGHDVSLAVV